jgi:hypothetical protein
VSERCITVLNQLAVNYSKPKIVFGALLFQSSAPTPLYLGILNALEEKIQHKSTKKLTPTQLFEIAHKGFF